MQLACEWSALADVTLIEFNAEEVINQPFRYQLSVLLRQQIDISALRYTTISVSVDRQGMIRYFTGYVWQIELLQQHADDRYRYEVVLVPWIQLLNQQPRRRCFKNRSVIDITQQVLQTCKLRAIDYAALTLAYPPCDYIVQYDETDFQFLSRLWQQADIHYYHRPARQQQQLVLFDDTGQLPRLTAEHIDWQQWQTLSKLDTMGRLVTHCFADSCNHLAYPGMHFSYDKKTYLLTRLDHYAWHLQRVEHYYHTFECQPIVQTLKSAVISKPLIAGVQHARVAAGCARIAYAWGESIAVPVMQQWAGAGWGCLMLPAVGSSITVGYVDGDPEKPVILGSPLSSMPIQRGFISKRGDALLFDAQALTLQVMGDLHKQVGHDCIESVAGNDRLCLKQGSQQVTLPSGQFSLTAQQQIRLQVGESYLQLTPTTITLHAPRIAFNL